MALDTRAKRLAARWLPVSLATVVLAYKTLGAVLARLGHPGATLDDAYIHFQYARAIAEGHPFRYQAGEPISTGATSLLWPALLAPFYAVGFRDEAILWPAWALSFAALGGLAFEAYALARPLAGRPAAIAAGAMVLAFGGFVWSAASGMEVVPFAWVLAHATRRACEWVEGPAATRTRRAFAILVALGVAAPLLRPEGAITSFALAVAVAIAPREGGRSRLARRAEALALVLTAFVPTLVFWILTGKPRSSTAEVKLLFGNPYFDAEATSLANARVLLTTILNGEVWSAEFLPKGGAPIACAGLVAVGWQGWATGRRFRAALVILLALTMFVPCTYVTFLWNRLRYLWPFATGWFIGLACLARALGSLLGFVDRRVAAIAPALIAGSFAGMLAVRLDWVIDDVAQSASGIDRQQVALGRWAHDNLPKDARIGVNDTGAIAYFGDRRTFDVVGLTTPSEGRFWVAGAASRLEHYERTHASAPSTLPTHFIVYPEWMGVDAVLGKTLHEAVVTDSSILGGQVMRASEARWSVLGTGDRPWTKVESVHDTLDVADLESEATHGYALLGARDGEQSATEENAPNGDVVVDGGRTNRVHDRFTLTVPEGGAHVLVARVQASKAAATLRFSAGTTELGKAALEPGPWTEIVVTIPDAIHGSDVGFDVSADEPFSSFHYWLASGAPATPP